MPKIVKGPVNAPKGRALELVATLNRKPANETRNTSIAILMSIEGNEYCKGQYAQATLSQGLKDHNQVFCIIGDELQKYNLEYTRNYVKSSITSSDRAILLGNQYLENNLPFFLNAITKEYPQFDQDTFFLLNGHKPISEQMLALNTRCERLSIPLEFIRWKQWAIDPRNKSAEIQEQIMPLFNMPESKLAIELEMAAKKFAGRRKFREKSPEERAFIVTQSKHFVREESLVIAAMLEDLNADYCAYAGKLPPLIKLVAEAYKTFQNLDMLSSHAKIENQLEIKFIKEIVPLETSEALSSQSDNHYLMTNQGRTKIETQLRIKINKIYSLDQRNSSLQAQTQENVSRPLSCQHAGSTYLEEDERDLTADGKIAMRQNEFKDSQPFYSIDRDRLFFSQKVNLSKTSLQTVTSTQALQNHLPEGKTLNIEDIPYQNIQYGVLLNELSRQIASGQIPPYELVGVMKQLLLLAGSITDLMPRLPSAKSNSPSTSIMTLA